MKKEIPPEHKCSRCGFDLREYVFNPCVCNGSHPRPTSKSGNNIVITNGDYHGGYTD